jgi:hypothetical protein
LARLAAQGDPLTPLARHGRFPKGQVRSMALEILRERGYDTSGMRSKGRVDLFTKLGIGSLERQSPQARLDAIAEIQSPSTEEA